MFDNNTNSTSFSAAFKASMNTYADFLNTLTTGKFLVYLLLVMIAGGLTGDLTGGEEFFSNLAALVALASIGIKVLNNRKEKTSTVIEE
jgi:hypothetical protein